MFHSGDLYSVIDTLAHDEDKVGAIEVQVLTLCRAPVLPPPHFLISASDVRERRAGIGRKASSEAQFEAMRVNRMMTPASPHPCRRAAESANRSDEFSK